MEELEPRQLLSADLVPLPAAPPFPSHSLLGESVVSTLLTTLPADAAMVAERHEVVFVDPHVPDLAGLLADLNRNADSARRLDVIVLDENRDGIVQVTEALADRVQIDAVHFITHGTDGAVQLGSTWLDSKTLAANIEAVGSWGHALKADGDLLFYGCDLAETARGRILINWIKNVTQTDVAASTDATGSAVLGGNWTLEYQNGAIEARIAVSTAERAQWSGTLRSDEPEFGSASTGKGALASGGEILFVDQGVPGYEQLIEMARPGVETIILDPTRDGVQQISEALASRAGMTAIHIVSHGAPGQIHLGNSDLSAKNINARAAELQAWSQALSADADILIYGCDVAASDAGRTLIDTLATATGADVAASTDLTGSWASGGDWVLEATVGNVSADLFATASDLASYAFVLPATNLTGSSPWTTVFGGADFDFGNDTQAASAADLVGGPNHGALYTNYDDAGTPGTQADDLLAFRVRLGGDNSSTLSGVVLVGIDANGDGAFDAFVGVDNQGSSNYIRIWDTGAGANTSPSTTTISTTGYAYAQTAANYDYSAVSAVNDPDWDGSTDLNANGYVDRFVTFQLPFQDLVTFLGTQGIGGVTKDTPLRYIFVTSTQNNSINGDIGGVDGGVGSSTTWSDLGVVSPPLSASNSFPSITSNGGGDTATVNVLSGTQAITTVVASDADGDTITYSITGGLDQARFTLNTVTGALIFTTAPNFYAPADSNGDNVYQVQVTASDGKGGTDSQILNITVTVGVVDNTAPTLVLTSPLDEATGVPTNSNIVLVFNEPVKLGSSGTFLIYQSDPPSGTHESFSVSSPQITVSGNTVIIDPTIDFSNNKQYYVQVTSGAITDLAGNAWSGISNTTDLNFKTGNSADTIPPAAPMLDLLAVSDTGVSNTDNLTSDTTPTIRAVLNFVPGSAPAVGDTVRLFLGATQLTSAVLSSGDIAVGYVDVTLSGLGADGAKSLTATITDSANNTSAASTPLVITLDTTATVSVSEPISGGFVNNAERTNVTISGSSAGVESGQTVTVTVSDTDGGTPDVTGTATVGAGGAWTVTGLNFSGLVDGNITVSAAVSDLAGNTADDTAAVILDVTAPAMPIVTGVSDDNGTSSADQLTNDPTLFFNGTAEASATVEVFVDGVSVGSAPVDGTGTWSFDYTATVLAAGIYNITARAFDAAGNQSVQSVALPLTVDTSPPTANILGAPAYHDGASPFTVTIEFNEDVSGFVIGDIIATGATLSTFTVVNPTTYTVQVTPTGTSPITIDVPSDVAQDAAGNPNTAVQQTVPYNDVTPPIFASQSFSYAENQAAGASVATVVASDNIGVTSFAFTATNSATSADGFFQIDNSGNITLTASGAAVGAASNDFETNPNSLAYAVDSRDAQGNSTTATITLNVTNLNDNAPAFGAPSYTFGYDENQAAAAVLGSVSATDADGDAVSYAITAGDPAGWFQINAAGEISLTATGAASLANDFETLANSHVLTVTATAGGQSTNATVTLNEQNLNDNAPVANADSATTAEDVPLVIATSALTANDVDVDGDPLTVISVGGAVNGTVSLAAGNVTFTPAANYNGPASFTYTVSDGNGGSATTTVNVTVTPVDDIPVGVNNAYATNEDTTLTVNAAGGVLANDTGLGDGGISLAVISGPANGALTLNSDGSFVYTPNADFNGTDSFSYQVTDADGDITSANVTINVNAVDDVPVAVNDTYTTVENTALAVNPAGVLANDTGLGDGGITLLVTAGPAFGVVALNNDGSFTYMPNAGYSGLDSFTYQLTDADGDTATATVNITVSRTSGSLIGNEVIGELLGPMVDTAGNEPPSVLVQSGVLTSSTTSDSGLTSPNLDAGFQPIPRGFFGWQVPPSIYDNVVLSERPIVDTGVATVKAAPSVTTHGGETLSGPVLGVLRSQLEEKMIVVPEATETVVPERATATKTSSPDEAVATADGRSLGAGLTTHPAPVEREPVSVLRTASPWLAGTLAGVVLVWGARRGGNSLTRLRALPGARFLGLASLARDEAEREHEQDPPRDLPR